MRERSGLLAAFLGISAILYQTGPSRQPSKSGTTDTSVTKASLGEEHATDWDLLRNLTEFYGFEVPRPGKTVTNNKFKVADVGRFTLEVAFTANAKKPVIANKLWHKYLNNKFDWIIATVPDPELSGMRLDFDREINAIQNAVESSGYQFDRYFFPWTLQALESRTSDGGNYAERSNELDSKRNLPGMLLFRTSPNIKPRRDLVVFLVGETPTSGIVPGQFKNAIRFGELSIHKSQIKIAGPGFSGSFDSLRQLVNSRQDYEIVTWTGDFDSQNRFQNRQVNISLRATNDSSRHKIRQFCHYVREIWQEPTSNPIVLLIEEGTAFGSGAAKHEEYKKLGLIYIIKFPRGISKLRNATEAKHSIPGFEESKGTDILRRELPFTLKEERVGSSELPFYSLEQSPVSQESVLFTIASLIKKGALHYAGIIASDPLDLLFLSRFLHSATPNTRLFTISSDLLFEHGVDGSDFQGILNITNYPLFAFNQIWTRSNEDSTLQIFPSENSESIYNAVVQLLPHTAHPKHYREYGNPFRKDFDDSPEGGPALWLTVASRNGYAPIAPLAFQDERDSNLKPVPIDQQHHKGPLKDKAPQWVPEYWESWGYSFACIWCLCLLYAAVILFAHPTGNRLFAIFSVKPEEPRPLPRAHFLFLLGLCLSVLVALWLAVPYIILRWNTPLIDPNGTNAWRYHALLLVLSGISLILCVGLLSRSEPEKRPTLVQWCGAYFAAGITLWLITIVITLRSEIHGKWISALLYGVFAVAAVAAPASITSEQFYSEQKKRYRFFFAWRLILSFTAAVTVAMVIVVCSPTDLIEKSPALVRLWKSFHGGAFILGVIIAASAVPLIDGARGVKQTQSAAGKRWIAAITSDIYLWLSISVGATLAVMLLWAAVVLHKYEEVAERFLAACRSINLTSGASPLMPLTLFMLALVIWCFVQLRRVSYHEDRCPSVPRLPDDVFCPELQKVIADVSTRIEREFFHRGYNVISTFAVLLASYVSSIRDHQTLEVRAMDFVMLSLALLVGVSLISTCMRFILIWLAFRELLLQLERHPVREIFGYLPRGFLWIPLWQGGSKKRTHVAITRSVECVSALINMSTTPVQLQQILKAQLPELTTSVKKLLSSAAAQHRVPASFYKGIQDQLSNIGTAVAMELEQNKWPHGSYEAKLELSSREVTKEALCVSKDEFRLEEPYTICSELLALRFVPFINYVLLQLQNLAMYLSTGFILLLTAMNCYVFRARTVIDWFLAVLFLVLGCAVIAVFSQLDKDAIFSRITQTKEGKLDRNFLFHMISYGAIPTLALLASHVPSVGKFFFSWIKPAMDAIH